MQQEYNLMDREDLWSSVNQLISSAKFEEIHRDCIANTYVMPVNIISKNVNENTLDQIEKSLFNGCKILDFKKKVSEGLIQVLKSDCITFLRSEIEGCTDQCVNQFFRASDEILNDLIPYTNEMNCDKTLNKDGNESNSDKKENLSSLCKKYKSLNGYQSNNTYRVRKSSIQKIIHNNKTKRSFEGEKKLTSLYKKPKLLNINWIDSKINARRSSKQKSKIHKNKSSSFDKFKYSFRTHKMSRKKTCSINILVKDKSISKNSIIMDVDDKSRVKYLLPIYSSSYITNQIYCKYYLNIQEKTLKKMGCLESEWNDFQSSIMPNLFNFELDENKYYIFNTEVKFKSSTLETTEVLHFVTRILKSSKLNNSQLLNEILMFLFKDNIRNNKQEVL